MKKFAFILLVVMLLSVMPGTQQPILSADVADSPDSLKGPASEEEWKRAEETYAERSRARNLVEHKNGKYVPADWYEKYGKMRYRTLVAQQRDAKKQCLADRASIASGRAEELKRKYHISKIIRKYAPNDPERAIDVVIIGDGFTGKSIGKFFKYASSLPNALVSSPPFNSFGKDMFNFHIFGVISEQDGVSTEGRKKNTVFGAYIKPERGNLLRMKNWGAASDYAKIISPTAELVIVVANTAASCRECARMGLSPGVLLIKRTSSINAVVRHELGHAFGGLADEYVECCCCRGNSTKPVFEPHYVNVTIATNPKKCKWDYWVRATKGKVGLFEGAHLREKYYYRSEKNCLMRCDSTKFCRVCMEEMMMNAFQSVELVKNITPTSSFVVLGRSGAQTFSFEPFALKGGRHSAAWLLDGKVISRHKTYKLSAATLKPGRHILTLAYKYKHPTVIRGQEYLERTFFWEIEVLDHPRPKLAAPSSRQAVKVGELIELSLKDRTEPIKDKSKYRLSVKCPNLPEGAEFNQGDMKFRWRPRSYQCGSHLLQFEARIGEVTKKYLCTIKVYSSKNISSSRPVILFIPDKRISEGNALSFRVEAVDLDHDSVSLTAENLPEGADFDPVTGEFNWIPGFFQSCEEGREITFKATDGGPTVSRKMTIFVRDSRSGAKSLGVMLGLVEKGEKGCMRNVEYGLISNSIELRSRALKSLRDYYGNAVLVECIRLLKSRNKKTSSLAAATAVEIINGSDAAQKGQIDFCLDLIKEHLWELRDHCGEINDVIAAVRDNKNLPKGLHYDAKNLLKKKVGFEK